MHRQVRVYFMTEDPKRVVEIFTKIAENTLEREDIPELAELLTTVHGVEIDRPLSNDEEVNDEATKERTSEADEEKEKSEAITQ